MMKRNKIAALFLTLTLVSGSIASPVFAQNNNSEEAYLDQISDLIAQDEALTETVTIDVKKDIIIDENGQVTEMYQDEFSGVLSENAAMAEQELAEDYTVIESDSSSVTIASPYQTKRLVVTCNRKNFKKEYKTKVTLNRGNEYILQFDTEEETQAAYRKLLKDKTVTDVWVDQVVIMEEDEEDVEAAGFTGVENGEHYSWGVETMGLDVMSDRLEKQGNLPEIVVAVIDTGINYNNPYLQGRIADGGKNYSASSGDYMDNYGHGTHVSGIIVDGTPSNVKILPIKVLGDDGRGTQLGVRSGVQYATNKKADVINLSLSGTGSVSSSDKQVFNAAVNSGAVVCVAAGNSASDVSTQNPASIDCVLSISNMTKTKELSGSSCYGEGIEFTAPGASILSTYKTGFGTKSGTSMAAPHVSAAAALIKSTNKNLNQSEIMEIFKQNCEDLGDPGKDTKFGYGLIVLSDYLKEKTAEPEQPVNNEPEKTEPEQAQPEQPANPEPEKTEPEQPTNPEPEKTEPEQPTTPEPEKTEPEQPSNPEPEQPEPETPVHNHDYTKSITKNATCTNAGVATFKCECGESYTVAIPATGHTYRYLFKLGRLYTYRCTKCNAVYTTKTKLK